MSLCTCLHAAEQLRISEELNVRLTDSLVPQDGLQVGVFQNYDSLGTISQPRSQKRLHGSLKHINSSRQSPDIKSRFFAVGHPGACQLLGSSATSTRAEVLAVPSGLHKPGTGHLSDHPGRSDVTACYAARRVE